MKPPLKSSKYSSFLKYLQILYYDCYKKMYYNHVHFLAAPSRPKGPLKVQDVTANSCKLKWEKPEDDGGKPITAYAVEKLDVATGRWVPVGRSAEPEMEVRGLQEGHEYQFRVKAINEEGESEPLDTESSTLAKNPYGRSAVDNINYILDCCKPSI